MELVESSSQDQDQDQDQVQDQVIYDTVPLGGPIYIPDLIGPITRVSEFEASVLDELQSLRAELCIDLSELTKDDLSVSELKILSEEELVEKALKEAFQDGENPENVLRVSEDPSNNMTKNRHEKSSGEINHQEISEKNGNTLVSDKCLDDSQAVVENDYSSTKKNSRKGKKRGRAFDRDIRAAELESSYIVKVQQLAKIKQKQEEDKASARLHSFNGSCENGGGRRTVPPLGNIEKMTSLKFITPSMKVKSSNLHEHTSISYPEVVLCVEIYQNTKSWVKSQEFLVLGRQTLTALRDQIHCLTDELMKKADQYDPSGYFLIEDVFCNDLRDPSAKDYSKPMFDWLRNSKDEAIEKWECILSGQLQQKQKDVVGGSTNLHLPQFKAIAMHKLRFCDLPFRLGAGYLYCHQGDCKHGLVIRDMRMLHPEDLQNKEAYPVLTFQMKTRVKKCSVCKIYTATKITVDDKWAGKNPCYFCDNCYYLLHYTEDGSLLYSYMGSEAMLMGLQEARTIGAAKLRFFNDALGIVQAVERVGNEFSMARIIVEEIKQLKMEFEVYSISYIARDFNKVADTLAKFASRCNISQIWDTCPDCIQTLVQQQIIVS